MKNFFIALSALSFLFVSCKEETKIDKETEVSVATDTIAEVEPSIEKPMDSVAVQKAYEAYMTPGDVHELMAAEEGTWTNEMTFWMGPDTEPQKATSAAEIKMILGGRYQQTTYQGNMMGMPFEGRSTLAYDNATEELTSTWIDNMGTGMLVLRGDYNEADQTFTFTGSMVDPLTGKEKKVREVYTIVDKNTRKMEMFEIPDEGEEYRTMEIIMTRK